MPGTFAAADELIGLAQAVVDAGGGLFEVVPTGETGDDADQTLGEIELMAKVSKATGLPLSFLLVQARDAPDLWRRQLEAPSQAIADGAHGSSRRWRPDPAACCSGLASYHGLMRRPTFRALEDSLPLDELAAEMRKPEVKAAILSEKDLPPDPKRQFESLTDSTPFMFEPHLRLGDPPDYEPTSEQSIAGIAEATGKDPWEVLYDHLAAGPPARRLHSTTPRAHMTRCAR